MALRGWCAFPAEVQGNINPILLELEEERVVKSAWFGQEWCTFTFKEDAVGEAVASWSRGEKDCTAWKVLCVDLTPEQFVDYFTRNLLLRIDTRSGFRSWRYYGNLSLAECRYSFYDSGFSVDTSMS